MAPHPNATTVLEEQERAHVGGRRGTKEKQMLGSSAAGRLITSCGSYDVPIRWRYNTTGFYSKANP